MVLGTSDLIAFVSTSDLMRARQFYADALGLAVVDETPLGCSVDDIDATVRGLAAQGAGFLRYEGMEQDPLGIGRSPSHARIGWFKDLDGNILSLTEFAP
jgi:catechol 2,3-dioxygenase-like lactoylglutathione lyase family enzyme